MRLPLQSCAIVGSLCKIYNGPSIFVLLVSLVASFFLRCASPRGGVDIVLLLRDRSLLLLFIMVDVFCFRCRLLLRITCTGGYVPRVVEIGGMVYIRVNKQTNHRIMRTSIQSNSLVSGFDGTRKTTDEEVREETVQNRQRNQKGLVSSIEWCKLGVN